MKEKTIRASQMLNQIN